MKKAEHIQSDLILTTLSPLHIGSGEESSSVGDFYTTLERVYFLDDDKLFEAIINKGKQEEYISTILQEGIGLDFYEVLKEWDINPTDYAIRSLLLHHLNLSPGQNDVLHLCMKTNNKAYVPGSSLKGLFRTAMIADYLLKNREAFDLLKEQVADALEQGKSMSYLARIWRNFNQKHFPSRVFHALRITDTDVLDNTSLCVQQVHRLSFFVEEQEKGVDWLLECISPEAELRAKIVCYPVFDTAEDLSFKHWKYLQEGDFSKLMEVLNNHSLRLIEFELALLHEINTKKHIVEQLRNNLEKLKKEIEQSKNQYAIARLGKGKTIFFQTLLPLLPKNIRVGIIGALQKEPGEIFPRSRVLTVAGNNMMGWVKLHLEKKRKSII